MAISRRALLVGAGATAGLAGAGALGVSQGLVPGSDRLRRYLADKGPAGTIPQVPEGQIRLERRWSKSRSATVGYFTAVPAGYRTGRGLPVCLILHGATATTADYRRFGFGRFLTAAVRGGVPPFVLAGVDGGRKAWHSAGDDDRDDPQRLLLEELPRWLKRDGYDVARMAAWGWSMGGHGALLLDEAAPTRLKAVAAFSPAIPSGPSGEPTTADGRPRDVWAGRDRIVASRLGLWCGNADALFPTVRRFADELPKRPALTEWAPGAHTRGYWDRVTPAAFRFIGERLA